MSRLIYFWGYFFLLCIHQVLGQKPPFVFHHLTMNEGLSEGSVRHIIEDSKGFMWFGSEDGFNKYDGAQFTIFRNNPSDSFSISGNESKALFNDKNGNLWIGTRNGINLYDHLYNRFYNYKNSYHRCFETLDGDIEAIEEDEYGNIWATVGNEGLYLIEALDKPAKKFIFQSIDNSNLLLGLKSDKKGTLWVGSRDGLLKFNIKTKTFTDVRNIYGKGYQVKDIMIDEQGRLWLSTTTEGIKIIDPQKKSILNYKHDPNNEFSLNGNNVIKIIPYRKNEYLIALDGTGIDFFNLEKDQFYHYRDDNGSQLSCNNITTVFKDSKGDIWAGTFLNGVDYSNSSTNLFAHINNNPLSQKTIQKGIVSYFHRDSHSNLWISTDGGGIYIRKKDSEAITPYEPIKGKGNLSEVPVINIIEDIGGAMWATTYGGGLIKFRYGVDGMTTYKYDPENKNCINSDNLRSLICDQQGNIWVSGFGTGLNIFNPTTGKFKQFKHDINDKNSIPSDWIQRIHQDANGIIWLATFKGLAKFNPKDSSFTTYTFSSEFHSSVESNYILDIEEDKYNTLWLGTSGGGLISFNPKTNEFKFYTVYDGLSNNNIRSLIFDSYGFLWLATNNGVTRFDTHLGKGKAYTLLDGVAPYSFYVTAKYRGIKGRIYFGNSKGFLVIDPKIIKKNTIIPPVIITDVIITGNSLIKNRTLENSELWKQIQEQKVITLPHTKNAITFEFAALNFNNSRRNSYLYKLEGLDIIWINSENKNTAIYNNLSPGEYTFKVKGSNNDGVWNEKEATIKFIILPPWWKTWWVIGAEIIVGLIILYLFYLWRVRRIRKKNTALEEIIKQRTSELEESNEQLETFIYKASHDIKGPLKSIIGLTTVGQKDTQDHNAKEYFDHILKSTSKLDTLLTDLLQLTRVKSKGISNEEINFEELIKEAKESFSHLPGYGKVKINSTVYLTKLFYSDKNLVYSIIQNLIENSIKYMDDHKKENYLNIYIETKSSDFVEAKFSDNGMGIPEIAQEKIFDMFYKVNEKSTGSGLGLYIVKTTIDKLGGHIEFTSNKEGTTFIIRLKNNKSSS